MSINCLTVKDCTGVRTIFSEKQRQLKSLKHPELREASFLKRIKETIEKPEFIYQDLAGLHRLVYYRCEYLINRKPKYIKVVVERRKSLGFVITAFRPDYVKERGKTKLIYGKDHA